MNIVEALCESLGVAFERRPIDRTELRIADEIALAGTLMELGFVSRFEDRHMPASFPVLSRVREEYWACVRGMREHPAVHLTLV